jgi:hypothetical protein
LKLLIAFVYEYPPHPPAPSPKREGEITELLYE